MPGPQDFYPQSEFDQMPPQMRAPMSMAPGLNLQQPPTSLPVNPLAAYPQARQPGEEMLDFLLRQRPEVLQGILKSLQAMRAGGGAMPGSPALTAPGAAPGQAPLAPALMPKGPPAPSRPPFDYNSDWIHLMANDRLPGGPPRPLAPTPPETEPPIPSFLSRDPMTPGELGAAPSRGELKYNQQLDTGQPPAPRQGLGIPKGEIRKGGPDPYSKGYMKGKKTSSAAPLSAVPTLHHSNYQDRDDDGRFVG